MLQLGHSLKFANTKNTYTSRLMWKLMQNFSSLKGKRMWSDEDVLEMARSIVRYFVVYKQKIRRKLL